MRETPPPPPHCLFVYGTLRYGGAAPMATWLTSQARWLGEARARGALYALDGYPGFVPDHLGGWVTGDLFALPAAAAESAALLAPLDAYEECTADFPEPHEYRRIICNVDQDAAIIPAWLYAYAWPVEGRIQIA